MSQHTQPRIRPAQPSDAPDLAKLIDIAGEGIPRWLWSRSCKNGEDPLDIGADRARRTDGGFSYRNALVAELDGRVVGMVLSYLIDKAPEDDPDDLPAPIAPFVELEAKSVGTWYINALAVFAGAQGRGVGSALMQAAEDQARAAGHTDFSIQVFSQNARARKLYAKLGYVEDARSAVRDHPCQPYYDEDVVLLKKRLAA